MNSDFTIGDFYKLSGMKQLDKMLQLGKTEPDFLDIEGEHGMVWVDYKIDKLGLEYGVSMDFRHSRISINRLECNNNVFDQLYIGLLTGIVNNSEGFFEYLGMWASGTAATFNTCPLYFFCAKYGFTPDPYYLPEMLKIHDELPASCKSGNDDYSAFDELFHTDEGLELWLKKGFSWQAEFSLSKNSLNIGYLEKELFLRALSYLLRRS